jgi:hypothetical protein
MALCTHTLCLRGLVSRSMHQETSFLRTLSSPSLTVSSCLHEHAQDTSPHPLQQRLGAVQYMQQGRAECSLTTSRLCVIGQAFSQCGVMMKQGNCCLCMS